MNNHGRIIYTKDYNKFKTIEGNRQKSNVHIKALKNSINQFNFLDCNPIIVREEGDFFFVVDGQHRLEACKQLDIPVPYTITKIKDLQMMMSAQIQKPWSIKDRLSYFVSRGYIEYIALKELMEKHSIEIDALFGIMIKNSFTSAACYRNGTFKLDPSISGFLDMIKTFRQETIKIDISNKKLFNKRSFIAALYLLYRLAPNELCHLCTKLRDLSYFKEPNTSLFMSGSVDFFVKLIVNRYNQNNCRGGLPGLKYPLK